MAVLRVMLDAPFDEGHALLVRLELRVVTHDLGIGLQRVQRVEIVHGVDAECKAIGLDEG